MLCPIFQSVVDYNLLNVFSLLFDNICQLKQCWHLIFFYLFFRDFPNSIVHWNSICSFRQPLVQCYNLNSMHLYINKCILCYMIQSTIMMKNQLSFYLTKKKRENFMFDE